MNEPRATTRTLMDRVCLRFDGMAVESLTPDRSHASSACRAGRKASSCATSILMVRQRQRGSSLVT